MPESPTSRTLSWLKEKNIPADIVERYIPFIRRTGTTAILTGGIRKDFAGIIDIIAFLEHGTIGIQVCANDRIGDHIQKILVEKEKDTIKWLKDCNRELFVLGWRKLKRGWDAVVVSIKYNRTTEELTYVHTGDLKEDGLKGEIE